MNWKFKNYKEELNNPKLDIKVDSDTALSIRKAEVDKLEEDR